MSAAATSHQVLRFPALKKKVGLGHDKIYEEIREGRFPKPFSLVPVKPGQRSRAVGWLEHEIDAWIAERAAQRDAQPSA